MKYLPYLLIALCFCMILGLAKAVKTTVSDLEARDTIHSNKISTLESKIGLCAQEKKALIAEIREITRPLTRLIFIDGGFLGVRDEKP